MKMQLKTATLRIWPTRYSICCGLDDQRKSVFMDGDAYDAEHLKKLICQAVHLAIDNDCDRIDISRYGE